MGRHECDAMTEQGIKGFYISPTGYTEIMYENDNGEMMTDGEVSVQFQFCPFCGEKFPEE